MPQMFRARRSETSRKVIRPKQASPREKGYDSRWDRYSKRYRQKHPFCAKCLEEGRTTLIVARATGVVDHKWPVSLGGPMWEPSNWWGLCQSHHNGWKRSLEQYAEETGQVEKLIAWCDDPESRPRLRGDV